MWRLLLVLAVVLTVALVGFALVDVGVEDDLGATALIEAPAGDTSGFTQAMQPLDWQFPRDLGAHPDFQTEWWYYTGNLQAANGDRFGFQFTIFRRAIDPGDDALVSASEWRSNQIYMAHFTVSDIARGEFYHEERYSRAGAGLAGATGAPRYSVWLEDWRIEALDDSNETVRIHAQADEFALDLTLEQVKPPAFHGPEGDGLSPKSGEEGNASYYYSLSRLVTEGTITISDTEHAVSGLSWKDHEFSTSALGNGAQGWDWFGLIFEDGRELMIGQIRLQDGGIDPYFGGSLIAEDSSTRYLSPDDFTITALDTWVSPASGIEYPSGWEISVAGEDGFTITMTPLMRNQELYGSGIQYWEGAVRVSGDLSGYGYAELTGYADTMQNRF